MPAANPGDATNQQPIKPGLTLHAPANWHVAPARPMVLGEADADAPSVPLDLFTPAETPIAITVEPAAPTPAVLGEAAPQPATLEYQPADEAVYVLLQEIHTPDGVIYDWTLPQPASSAGRPQVLGEAAPGALVFPINPLVSGGPQPAGGSANRPAVLGIEHAIGDTVGGFVGDIVAKRVLHVLKSPIDRALLAGVQHFEGAPQVLALRDGFQPLEGFESWRALLPPEREHRILLYIHGFGSNTAGSGGARLVPQFAAQYDAVLSYDHPTIGRSPLENAQTLLEMIPPDLRLSVDLVAHSRGGLVARSLIELLDWPANLRPQRLITAGTPHAGTRLADHERWDKLVSIAMTLGSWMITAGGGAFWAPKLLEYVLKAAAQGIFDLPGLGAMTPGGAFLQKLNAPGTPDLNDRVRYSAVTSSFAIDSVMQQGFRQAFSALAAQAFMGMPNDLVVMTDSALEIDKGSRTLAADQQFKTNVAHGGYFQNPEVAAFVRRRLNE